MTALARAVALAGEGRGTDAVALLRGDGSPEAKMLLGLWQIEGVHLPRDKQGARDSFAQSAAGGFQPAARILAGLTATGFGAPGDWAGAVGLLRDAPSDAIAQRQIALIDAMDLDATGQPRNLPSAEPVTPAIRWHRGLFTPDECALLIELAGSRQKPARIWHDGRGEWTTDPVRRSSSAGFSIVYEWPFVYAVNRRIAAATGTDWSQGEPLQVLRYQPGDLYAPHIDAVPGLANQRAKTFLIWLNDGYEGGETQFDRLGINLRGNVGDACEFDNLDEDGRPNAMMRHEGLPVTQGVKLLASRWLRQRPGDEFGPSEVSANA